MVNQNTLINMLAIGLTIRILVGICYMVYEIRQYDLNKMGDSQ
jgi:hypothetical protein